MTSQDPDEDARRLSGEALRDGDPTGWFERLYADAAQGQAIVRGTAEHRTRCWSSGSSSSRIPHGTAPSRGLWTRRRRGVPRGPRIPRTSLSTSQNLRSDPHGAASPRVRWTFGSPTC